jgi:hypothetical protein
MSLFKWLADYLTYDLFKLTPGEHLADSLIVLRVPAATP